jgi:hypothetical protein
MAPITIVFAVVAAVLVFAIAAGVVGREAHRLDAVAPRVVYEIDNAVQFVADNLPAGTQARLTIDEVRALLLGHLNWMSEKDLMPIDVVDKVQNISTPVVADDVTLAAFLLREASTRGVNVLDDVDIVYVVETHNKYLAAIGAVGPEADAI